ncbi:hypothetical protein FPCIR_13132 [Fusarium pseudocircinatum]|uniref:Major facilitator superfamily (MFS) profile domain-containing protein n=1 Tax=Fusarium pseudocircinatum TaxID=56676 RepID=A0A8H5KP81_9HYPO|nr:hypothetical protein FPCIR_13132 [Fusarium pseudocircinatum]
MWVYHLFPQSKNAHLIGDLEYRFSLEAMAIMDIPTFVRGRDTPTLGIWGFLRSAQKASSTGLVGGVESVSGLPRNLLDIFARMAHDDVEKDFADWEGHEGSIPHVHLWEAFRISGILIARRQKRTRAGSPSNEMLVCRLVATLDALYETRKREEYAHILATNSMLYPYTAARLEVTILQTRPSWVRTLRRCGSICDAYRDTPNALILEEILDKALERGDNEVDLDRETKDGRHAANEVLCRSEIILVPTPSQDPNDPLNWSKRRKAWNFTLVLAVTVAFFSAIVMQMVLWQQMIIDMHVTYDQLNYGVAFNSAGLALGSFLFIPLARKYGSRPCYILSTGLMAAVSWWSGRMETVGEIYVTNFLSGLAASINETISEITIADLFFVHQRGTANGFYIMAVMVGQFVCPCIVGVQAAAQDWRWTYYTTGIVLTVLFLLFIFFFEETKFIPVTIGETHNTSSQGPPAFKNSKDDPTQADIQDSDLNSETHPPRLTYKQKMRFITRTDEPLWRNYLVPLKMFLFPHVLFSALQVASCVAFLILLTSSISMIFSAPPYNFNTAGVGLMSLGPFVGNFLGSVYGGVLGDWVVVKLAKRNKGIFEPEMRLYILLLPALLMGGGLVFFGISADKGWHWIYPSIGGAMFGFGMASMIDISCTIVIDIYQTLTAEAFISVTFIRNIPSIGVPFGVVGWISSIGISKLFIISGCVTTLVCLLFIPCAIWGRRVRESTWQIPYALFADSNMQPLDRCLPLFLDIGDIPGTTEGFCECDLMIYHTDIFNVAERGELGFRHNEVIAGWHKIKLCSRTEIPYWPKQPLLWKWTRKLLWMALIAIGPEYGVAVALAQYLQARDDMKKANTLANGLVPRITEEDISDLGKSDAFTKVFALLQCTWLVVQSIARAAQGHAISQLELSTLAFIPCALAMYILWWQKPFGIERRHILLRLPVEINNLPVDFTFGIDDFVKTEAGDKLLKTRRKDSGWDMFGDLVAMLPYPSNQPTAKEFRENYIAERRHTTGGTSPGYSASASRAAEETTNAKTLKALFRKVLLPFLPSIVMYFTAVVFSAIHLAAWNWEFPSHLVRELWRWFALAALLTSLTAAVLTGIAKLFEPLMKPPKWLEIIIEVVIVWPGLAMFLFYTLARLVILGLTLYSLSSMPERAYGKVSWMAWIPYFS